MDSNKNHMNSHKLYLMVGWSVFSIGSSQRRMILPEAYSFGYMLQLLLSAGRNWNPCQTFAFGSRAYQQFDLTSVENLL